MFLFLTLLCSLNLKASTNHFLPLQEEPLFSFINKELDKCNKERAVSPVLAVVKEGKQSDNGPGKGWGKAPPGTAQGTAFLKLTKQLS